jgi:hypothetical protein
MMSIWKTRMEALASEAAVKLSGKSANIPMKVDGKTVNGWRLCNLVTGGDTTWTASEDAILGEDGVGYALYVLQVSRADEEGRKNQRSLEPLSKGSYPDAYYKKVAQALKELLGL